MIIWLASYPKSGNTWLRAFLSSYLYLDSNSQSFHFDILKKIERFPHPEQFENIGILPQNIKNFEEVVKAWIPLQKKINENKKINFLKTHNAFGSLNNYPFTDKNNTLGLIYLVRDPRDVLISYSKHLNKDLDKTLKYILTDNHMGILHSKINVNSELRGSWNQNYNSWKNFNLTKKIIIRYEDLVKDPFNTFSKVVNYLKKLFEKKSLFLAFDKEKIRKCIEITNFNNLQNLEKRKGFKEGITSNELFFNKGKIEQWKEELDEKILYKIEKKLKKEMKELNYL